jgi:hypothetical protein
MSKNKPDYTKFMRKPAALRLSPPKESEGPRPPVTRPDTADRAPAHPADNDSQTAVPTEDTPVPFAVVIPNSETEPLVVRTTPYGVFRRVDTEAPARPPITPPRYAVPQESPVQRPRDILEPIPGIRIEAPPSPLVFGGFFLILCILYFLT